MARVVMLAGPGDSTNIVFNAIEPDLVILEERVSPPRLIRRRIEKLGLGTVVGQVLFRAAIVPLLRQLSKKRVREIKRENGLAGAPVPRDKIIFVQSVNDDSAVMALKRANPDVVVVNGTRIIAEKVLRSVPATFLNTHAGITPLYRGVHGGYWALVNKDRANCGVTVHVVDAGIDTGDIVYQARIEPSRADNFLTYPYLQLAAAIDLLRHAISGAANGTIVRLPPPRGDSRLWTHPTAVEYVRNLFGGVR
jgi:methionyl-tRNA formyltransferase